MANNKMLVDERQRDLGNFMVGRLLPFKGKRQVGPFTFIDHMGPAELGPGNYLDVNQHPHIGLSTLTYLFEGEIEHRDSMGSVQVVAPGDVGFMTAGRAVAHTERTPVHLRDGRPHTLHGYQIWVALPKEREEMDPRFDFYPASGLPRWEENNCEIIVVAGEAFGRKSPLEGYSPFFMVDIKANEDTQLDLGKKITGEVAFVIVHGEVVLEEEQVGQGQMLISKTREMCTMDIRKGTRILLFGGEPLPEERFLLWNFVSSSRERLKEARVLWEERKFPQVPGDQTYIPFP